MLRVSFLFYCCCCFQLCMAFRFVDEMKARKICTSMIKLISSFFFFLVFKLLIDVVPTNDGYVSCLLMVVLHTIISIGVCVQLIYVIPVISIRFVVSEINEQILNTVIVWWFIIGFDDCSSNPCPLGTVCLDTKDGFSCICPPWQSDCTYGKRKNLTILNTWKSTNFHLNLLFLVAFNVGCTCKNGGRCMMGLGTYICECPYGYTGVNCETRKFWSIRSFRIQR